MSNDSKKQWTNRRGAQPVSDLVSKLLDPVIERRAGMTTDLIAAWEEIVGEAHAARSRPDKLQWPRSGRDLAFGAGHDSGGGDGFEPATLIIACDGGYALFLQHDSDTILSQVNDYFGFFAVNRIKLTQKPITADGSPKTAGQARDNRSGGAGKLAADKRARLDDLVGQVENEDLRKALEKLGLGVFSEGSSHKD